MKLALGFNPVLTPSEAVGVAREAESKGFDSVWMHESLFQRDVVSYVSTMLGATAKIKVGSGVLNTFTRHPVTTATTFATLAELSGGRAILGIGLGSFPTVPLIGGQIFPVEKTRPLKRVREYIQVVKSVLGGKKVDFEGEFFNVHNLTLGFEPKHRVPLFVASLSPKTLRFAASEVDGVILSPALNTAWGVERMVGWAKKGERPTKPVEKASYILTSVDRDPEKAAQVVKDYYFFAYQLAEVVRPEVLAPYGIGEEDLAPFKEAWKKGGVAAAKNLIPDEAVEVLAASGTPGHVLDRVEEYSKAGVSLPILMPIGDIGYAIESLAPVR